MAETKEKKVMPKGGRKGGTVFPRLPLADALKYSTKLVAKTHAGPQESAVVLAGVFGSGESRGKIRAATLKQYGLLKMSAQGMEASDLARAINAAPPENRSSYVQQAFLTPKVFKTLYDTFHGDTISRARIRQPALALKVHPESVDDCVEMFVVSLGAAKLGQETANGVEIAASGSVTHIDVAAPVPESEDTDTLDVLDEVQSADPADDNLDDSPQGGEAGGARAVFHVNVSLDSSLDTEKLEKQLRLLRKYGAI